MMSYELGSVLNTNKGFSHLVLIRPYEIDTHYVHVTCEDRGATVDYSTLFITSLTSIPPA